MADIKYVIFDVGGVLVTERIEPVMESLNRKLGKDVFRQNSELHKKALTGEISLKEYYTTLAEECGIGWEELLEMSQKEYESAVPVNKSVMALASKIRRNGVRTAILSDVTPEHKEINTKNGLYENFDPVVLSCDVGFRKPQKEIFEIVLKSAGVRPEESVFIDDRERFADAARSLGMRAILFNGLPELKLELGELGIKF